MRIIDYFKKGVDSAPEAPMFIDAASGTSASHAEIKAISDRAGAALAAVTADGTQAHVAVYSPNDPRAFACMLACWQAGGVWIPMNNRNAVSSNIEFALTTEVSFLFYHSCFAEAVAEIKGAVGTLTQCVCIDRDCDGDLSLDAFMQAYSDNPVPELEDDNDRRVAIMGSGGTTGKSKGIVHTARVWENMFASAWQIMPYEQERAVHLMAAPMTHAAGVLTAILMPHASTNVVMDKVDPLALMQAIERYGVTHLFLPPTALYAMLAHPDVRNYDYSSLRYFLISAAPVSPDKLREAVEVFGPCMCSCWAQAESPFFLTWLSPAHVREGATEPGRGHLLRSCGKAVILNRVAVMDDDNQLLSNNERGELVMKGNLRMDCYYKNPEATAEIRDSLGWQHTGDVGYRDEEGFFYIVDRKKDMIVTGGFNVYCAEIEAFINAHPAVQDCAVFGVPDDKWGEAVKAAVQLKPAQEVSESELIDFCKKGLASVKAPKSIDFIEALPRSPVGKVLKRQLRDAYWQGRDRQVG